MQDILRGHPCEAQLRADPDYFLRRMAPATFRELQDRRFRRTPPTSDQVAQRVANLERKVELMKAVILKLVDERRQK